MDQKLSLAPILEKRSGEIFISFSQILVASSSSSKTVTHRRSSGKPTTLVKKSQAY